MERNKDFFVNSTNKRDKSFFVKDYKAPQTKVATTEANIEQGANPRDAYKGMLANPNASAVPVAQPQTGEQFLQQLKTKTQMSNERAMPQIQKKFETQRLEEEKTKLEKEINTQKAYMAANEKAYKDLMASGLYSNVAQNSLAQKTNAENKVAELQKQLDQINAKIKVNTIDEETKKYRDTNKDTFFGRAETNYDINVLQQKLAYANNDYLDNPTEENKKIAEAYRKAIQEAQENNPNTAGKGGWLDKSLAGYLPQLGNQLKAGGLGGATGAVVAGGLTAAGTALLPTVGEEVLIPKATMWGFNLGSAGASAADTYKVMRGMAYQGLLDEGIDEETARLAASDEAFVNAAIEFIGNLAGGFILGTGKLAGKGFTTLLSKSGNKVLREAGEKALQKGATEVAKKATVGNIAKNIGKAGVAVGIDALGEGAEEGTQQVVSIANVDRAEQGKTGKLNLVGEAVKKASNLTDEEKAEVSEATKEGIKIGLMVGGGTKAITGLSNSAIDNHNAKVNQLENEIKDLKATYQTQQAMNAYKKLSPYSKYQPAEVDTNISTKDIKPRRGLPEGGKIYVDPQGVAVDSRNYVAPRQETIQTEEIKKKNELINKISNNTYLADEDKINLINQVNSTEYTEELVNGIDELLGNVNEELGLKNISNNFKDNKAKYGEYLRDTSEYDKTQIDNAKNSVAANKSGRRTKEQWLQVAKNLGSQIYEMSDAEIEKLAYKTWMDNKPNNKENLNRQGQKYVKFGLDEWVNTVYDEVKKYRAANPTQKVNNKLPTQAQNVKYSPVNAKQVLVNPKNTEVEKNVAPESPTNDFQEQGKQTILPTQKIQETVNSAKIVGMSDFDVKKATEIHKMLQSGTKLKFYDPQNIPEGVNQEKASRANGFYQDGVLWLNKNSDRKVQKIIGHELTHYLEDTQIYKDFSESILKSNLFYDYITSEGFDNVEQFKDNLRRRGYKDHELEYEMVSIFVEDNLFDSQEKINRLARENRTLAQKILNWLSDMKTRLVGTSQEKELLRIENMYRKALEQARNVDTTSTDAQYSIAGVKGKDNINDIDLSNTYNEARSTDENTKGWFKDKEGKWKFEFSDKDMRLKENLELADKGNKLGDILEHDLLFRAYPELRNTVVNFKYFKNGSGFFDKRDGEITLNKKLFSAKDWKTKVEASLLHEIQHAIQEIEGHSGAANPFWSKKAYYETLGEIEAADTKERFLKEKAGILDRNTTKPRTSETNPKHPRYNEYMQNRGIVDKTKDAIFPYYAGKGEKGYEISEENNLENHKADLRTDDNRGLRRYVKDIAGREPAFSLPETDNQGRKLSAEQQEFFKDSKVRDEEGRLLEVYHGTNSDFTVFDIDRVGTAHDSGWYGNGFYFATHKAEAEYYTDNMVGKPKVFETYLDIKKPFIASDLLIYNGEKIDTMGADNYVVSKNLIEKFPELKDEELYLGYDSNTSKSVKITNETFVKEIEDILNRIQVFETTDIKGKDEYGYRLDNGEMIYPYSKKNTLDNKIWRAVRYWEEYNTHLRYTSLGKWENFLMGIKDGGFRNILINHGYDGIFQDKTAETSDEIVAFYPNQIKNVDNTNPTENADIRYSIDGKEETRTSKTKSSLLDEIAPINESKLEDVEEEKVANILTRTPKTKAKDMLKQSKDVLMRKLVDAGHTIDTVGKITGDKNLYQYFNNTKQARQSAEYMIGEAQTDIQGNRVGNSLMRVFEPIRAKGDEYTNKFFEYLLHMHNIDRMKQNKPVFGKSVTAEDSSLYVKELLKEYPEFEKAANKVYAYNRNLMQWRVDSGLISQEQADIMNEMYPHYVPTFRNVSGTAGSRVLQGGVQVANTVRKATGSNKDILPIDASMARQTMQTVQAAKRNLLGNRLLNDVLNNKEKVAEYVQAVEKTSNKNDLETELETPNDINLSKDNNTFKIFRNGETYVMQVNNGIYEGLKSISSEIDNTDTKLLLKPIKAINNTFKKLITGYSPMFTLKNFSRDIQDSGLYAKELRAFIKKYPNTYKEMLGNGEMWQLYKSLGGTGSSFFDYETGIEKTLDSRNKTSTKIKELTVGKVEELNMMIEQAPRFAEFMATIEKAGNQNYDTLMEAMLNAADITVNFGRSGTWGKVANETAAPFFNPSVQGFDKFARTILQSRDGKKFLKLFARVTLLGIVPTVVNELLYWDDEDYENLSDRDKDTYFLIKTGDNKWLKIPKGRVLSIFGNTAARGLRTLKGEKWDKGEFLKNQLDQTAPINLLESNLYSPIQAVNNNKTWYGSNIVPQRLEDYAPKDQYDENTDAFSKWLGGKINYSPKKINYLIDAYTGIIGDVALPLSTPKAETNPFTKAFVIDGVTNNEISNDFYNMLDEYNPKQSNKESAKEVTRYLNKQSTQVSDINKQIREIENSGLSNAEKKKQVRELRELINTIELTAMATVPQYEKAVDKYKGTFADEEVDSDYAYLFANRDIFGAEYAVKTFSKSLYNNHKDENMEKFFRNYFTREYFQKKLEPEKKSTNTLPTLSNKTTNTRQLPKLSNNQNKQLPKLQK